MKDLKEMSSVAMISHKKMSSQSVSDLQMRATWSMKTYWYFKVLKLQHISLIDFRFHFELTYVYGNFCLVRQLK